jgi:hypothetical protein
MGSTRKSWGLMAVTFVGFDSAWTDSSKTPGAICSIVH